MTLQRLCVAVCASLLSVGSPAIADLLSNPDFELPVVAPGTYLNVTSSGAIPDWELVGSTVLVIEKTYTDVGGYIPSLGNQSLDLTGFGDTLSGVQQTVATMAGNDYLLTFDVGDKYDPTIFAFDAAIEVFINGISAGIFGSHATDSSVAWSEHGFQFTAASDSTQIRFMNTVSGDFYSGLDNALLSEAPVIITEVPEPASLALAAIGAGGMLILKRLGRLKRARRLP